MLAAQAAHRVTFEVVNAGAVHMDFTLRDVGRRGEQADDSIACHGFSRAGFTNHAEDFTGGDVVGYIVHRAQDAMAGGDFNGEVLDGEGGVSQCISSNLCRSG